MCKSISRRALSVLLCLFLVANTTKPAKADSLQNVGRDITLGIVGVAAGIAVVIVLVVHSMPKSAKGCVRSGPDGLEFADSSDKMTYELTGDTASIKSGDLVKVKGKKKHGKKVGAKPTFTVTKLSQDYGACTATPNP